MFAPDLVTVEARPVPIGLLESARSLENVPSTTARSTGARGVPQEVAAPKNGGEYKEQPKKIHAARPSPTEFVGREGGGRDDEYDENPRETQHDRYSRSLQISV